MDFPRLYLTREGVVFGPYTEFQMLEGIRLGIFEGNDLAWSEERKEWLEICQLLPVGQSAPVPSPGRPVPAVPVAAEPEAWREVSTLLPGMEILPVTPSARPRRAIRLTEQQLREHETLFAPSALTMFLAELTRWDYRQSFSGVKARFVN